MDAPLTFTSFLKEKLPGLLLAFLIISLIVSVLSSTKNSSISNSSKSLPKSPEARVSTEVVVDIGGAVEKPGLYTLPYGSRVGDLLALAGGLSSGADPVFINTKLNLAQQVTDGQKIVIPVSGSTEARLFDDGTLSINSATLSQLESLPGIGPAYAELIVKGRPYTSFEDLATRSGVRVASLDKLKNLINFHD